MQGWFNDAMIPTIILGHSPHTQSILFHLGTQELLASYKNNSNSFYFIGHIVK